MSDVAPVPPGTDWVAVGTILGGVAGAVSAVFAYIALRATRADAKRLATFEHLREVSRKNAEFWARGEAETFETLIDAYRKDRSLTEAEQALQDWLASLDIFAFAMLNGAADQKIGRRYIRNVLKPELSAYVRRIQETRNDVESFNHLSALCDREAKRAARLTIHQRGKHAWKAITARWKDRKRRHEGTAYAASVDAEPHVSSNGSGRGNSRAASGSDATAVEEQEVARLVRKRERRRR